MNDMTPTFVDGLAVYRRTRPGARRVLLVHGSMDRSASFVKASRRLDDLDIVRYDRRGYGRSVGAGVCATIDEQATDLLTVLGETPAVVVGHSLGGLIALMASMQGNGLVSAVGAFEAPMPWLQWWPRDSAGSVAMKAAFAEGPEAAAETFMRRMIGDQRWERLPASTRAARRAEGPALASELRAVRDVGEGFAFDAINVPVVAGLGSASDGQHQRAARVLAEEAHGASLITLEGATHGAHYGDPDGFAAFVRATVTAAWPEG